MKKRVLIADDTALFREMIKNALGSEEYQIVGEAVSGGQAVDMYKEKKPDLMILDINMPKMNGIDALAAVMDYDPEAKVIMCSTNPTTGGVDASFAMLADITLAEPGARIGFAGPRVIEKTLNRALPKGFQKAERVLECGFIDDIVTRDKQRDYLEKILKIHNC